MAVKFVLDRAQKREEELIDEILETIKTKPRIDESTKKLATFIDVVFRTAKKKGTIIKHKETAQRPQLLEQAPIDIGRDEYLLRLFETPVGILVDKENGRYLYQVMEPQADWQLIQKLKAAIRKDFERNHMVLEDKIYMRGQTENVCKKLKMKCDADVVRRASYYIKRDLLGFRRLDSLMHDINVKGIFVDGVNQPVKVDYQNLPEKIETNVTFTDPKDLNTLINRIAALTNKKISSDKPILEMTLNGFDIHATMGVGGISSKLIIKKLEI